MKLFSAAVLAAALLLRAGAARGAQLPPRDESGRDPSFAAVRDRLREAVATKDEDLLLSLLAPDVKLSFDGRHGLDDFRAMWLDAHSPRGDLWRELEQLLELGFARVVYFGEEEYFIAPYFFVHAPRDNPEPALVVGTGIRLRAGPSLDARIRHVLSWETVELLELPYWEDSDAGEGWVQVRLDDGREGFVARRFVRSWVHYRIGFKKSGGEWLVDFFLAGD